MSLGIFVEGPSDKQTIPILIRKLGYRAAIHPRVMPQGSMLDASKMSRQIDALLVRQTRVNRVIVFRDSEGVDPQATLRLTEPVSTTLSAARSGVRVGYVVVDHSLEGWLACDVEALRAVLGSDATIQIRANPENHLRPAELMDRIFKVNGKNFVKTVHNQRIAEAVTPNNIAEKSPTFRRFADLLRRGGV